MLLCALTAGCCFPMQPCGFSASNIFPMQPCGFSASSVFPMQPCGFSASSVLLSGAPASNIFPMALSHGAQASNISADTAPPASNSFPMALCPGAPASNISADTAPPASNKPHSAERSTPVWLAIWRTWAGFANSQLRRATIRAPNNISAHPPCCHIGRCSDRANLSTHLHRLPTPPPYLRRMRLSPGRGAGVGWQMMLLVVRAAVPANHRARESLF